MFFGQIFVQGIVMSQGSVGNGLFVVVVGFVLGRLLVFFVQFGMLYGIILIEMLLKGVDSKLEEYLL